MKLIKPTWEQQAAAEAFKQEFFDCGETIINGSALLDQMDYGNGWKTQSGTAARIQSGRIGWLRTHFSLCANQTKKFSESSISVIL